MIKTLPERVCPEAHVDFGPSAGSWVFGFILGMNFISASGSIRSTWGKKSKPSSEPHGLHPPKQKDVREGGELEYLQKRKFQDPP